MSFMISAQINNVYNRSLQRKRNTGFRSSGLPLGRKSEQILEPVSPLIAQRFKAKMESDRKRKEMATGLALILIFGMSAALILLIAGLF